GRRAPGARHRTSRTDLQVPGARSSRRFDAPHRWRPHRRPGCRSARQERGGGQAAPAPRFRGRAAPPPEGGHNPMSGFGDDGREMPHAPTFDDGAIDAILAGQPHGNDFAALGSFVEDVRSAAEAVPTPSPALAAALASGISPQAPAPMPKWRKVSMK